MTETPSINLRKLKSYQVSFPTTMLYNWKLTRKKKVQKNTNTWRLNNLLLTNQWITKKIKEETKKYLEANDNKYIRIQNPWDVAKAVLRGKFIAIQA